jgi:hypothetical protein
MKYPFYVISMLLATVAIIIPVIMFNEEKLYHNNIPCLYSATMVSFHSNNNFTNERYCNNDLKCLQKLCLGYSFNSSESTKGTYFQYDPWVNSENQYDFMIIHHSKYHFVTLIIILEYIISVCLFVASVRTNDIKYRPSVIVRVLTFFLAFFIIVYTSIYFVESHSKTIRSLDCLTGHISVTGYDYGFKPVTQPSYCNGLDCLIGNSPVMCKFNSSKYVDWIKVSYDNSINVNDMENQKDLIPLSKNINFNILLPIMITISIVLSIMVIFTDIMESKLENNNPSEENLELIPDDKNI